jgi:hypothetical protein
MVKPCRIGWYDIERRLNNGLTIISCERAYFSGDWWIPDKTGSGMAIWVSTDFWRGVAIDPETLK